MKNLIFTVITVASTLFATAQNGGQYNENNSVKLQYSGYSAGNNYVTITNKKDCAGIFNFEYNGDAKQFTLAAFADTLLLVGPSIQGVIKVKSTAHCSGFNDNGWVELNLSALPLTFTSNPVVSYDQANDRILIKVGVTDVNNVKHIKLRVSFDGGKTKHPLALLMLDYANPNTTYTYAVKRTDVLKLQ